MQTAEFIDVLGHEGRSMIAAALGAGWDAEVPSCPGWQVRDLVRHQGLVHRWATGYLAGPLREPVPIGEDATADEELAQWFTAGHRRLVETLAAVPDEVECWTFLTGSPHPRGFWARRQTHETTIHRVDAELAEGQALSPVHRTVAADGIDELLRGFHTRERSRVRTAEPRTLRVRTTDGAADLAWTVELSSGPPRVHRSALGPGEPAGGAVDCELSGPAELLYLALWNRLPHEGGLTATGDAELLHLWRERSAVV